VDSKDTNDERDPSVNCPLRLARHKASGQNVDALKEPNRSEKHEQDTDDDQRNPHGDYLDLQVKRSAISEADELSKARRRTGRGPAGKHPCRPRG
jgi:hypothetical protein